MFWITLLLLISLGVVAFLYVQKLKKGFEQHLEAEKKRYKEAEKQIVELKERLMQEEEHARGLRESREKLRRALYHDMLTKLPRKELFQESLKTLFDRRRLSPFAPDFAVIILELEQFKKLNDTFGNFEGDKLISEISERLRDSVGEKDFLARLEGAKFGIILANCDESEAKRFADLLCRKLQAPFKIRNTEIVVVPFLGITIVDGGYDRIEEILRDAEIALQEAREVGRNYAIFDQDMHDKRVRAYQLEVELRNALERGEFQPYFQPIVSLQTLLLTGFEVLIRWNHPKRGLVPPSHFIGFCEKIGLIEPLTYWILKQSCKKLFYWQEIMPDLTLSVNLSGKHFAKESLYSEVEKIIHEANISPSSLKLELTESEIMEDAEKAVDILKKFKRLGVQIMIDDFGTGYSSLSYLHRFPVNSLKVDRSFVNGMEEGTENIAIVKTIITLAKALGISVVAEGIETTSQLYTLRDLGCQMGQGFLFSAPLPGDKAERLLLERVNWQKFLPRERLKVEKLHETDDLLDLPLIEVDESKIIDITVP